jgi:ferredoxin
VAVRISDAAIETVADRPTPLYAQHYLRVNALLDEIGVRVANWLEERGAKALPLPASQTLDREKCTSFLSHKAVAVAAGLAWQGKSLLAVSPEHGPRIRLTTVLTDADLAPDPRLRNRCGACTKCTDACPAGAIKERQHRLALCGPRRGPALRALSGQGEQTNSRPCPMWSIPSAGCASGVPLGPAPVPDAALTAGPLSLRQSVPPPSGFGRAAGFFSASRPIRPGEAEPVRKGVAAEEGE